MKKCFWILALLSQFCNQSLAQDVQQQTSSKSISFAAGLNYAEYYNKNIYNDPYLTIANKPRMNFEFQFTRNFTDKMGFSVGAVYNQYYLHTVCSGFYKTKTTTPDFFGDPYYTGYIANYNETIKFNAVEFPLLFNLNLGKGSTKLNFDIGLIPGASVGAKNVSKGELTKVGYYPTSYQNVYILVDSDPYYGWGTTTKTRTTDLEVQKMFLPFGGGIGFTSDIGESYFLKLRLFYSRSLGDVTAKAQRDKQYANVMEEKSPYQKAVLMGAGINIGFGIRLQ